MPAPAGPALDEDRVAAALQQCRVALADVERGHAEGAVGRWRQRTRWDERRAKGGHDGDEDGGGQENAAATTVQAAGQALDNRRCHEHGGKRAQHDKRCERQRHLRARQPGRQPREADEIAEQRTGDGDQRLGEHRRELAQRRRGQAEPHDRRDGERREDVGRQRDERDAIEVDGDQRCGGERRGDRHRDGLGDRRGEPTAVQPLACRARDRRDPDHRREAQLPARVGRGPRVQDEHVADPASSSARTSATRAARRARPRSSRRPRRPTLNRRPAARQRNVERDQRQDDRPARADPDAGDHAKPEREARRAARCSARTQR